MNYKSWRFFIILGILIIVVMGIYAGYRKDRFTLLGIGSGHKPKVTRNKAFDAEKCILYGGNPNIKAVALTFDDAPHGDTNELLDILRAENVRATFFIIGNNLRRYPELARNIAIDGHAIGNHTENHIRLDSLDSINVRTQLANCSEIIERASGVETHLMRPPGMRYDDLVIQAIAENGYILIDYGVVVKDTGDADPKVIASTVINQAKNGSIILLHDGSKATHKALPEIIKGLKKKGFTFVTINEMMDGLNIVKPNSAGIK